MKSALALVVVMLLFAAPAFAGDGNVSQGTLSSLGLGDMQVVSDAQGMEVRGMSSSAQATSLSLFAAIIVSPITGSQYIFADTDFARVTDENAGLNNGSSATVMTAAASLSQSISETFGGATFTATFGAINVSGSALATSP